MIFKQKIFLASKSPRRHELLTAAKIPFEFISVDVDEVYPESMNAYKVPEYLAELKAKGARKVNAEGTILTADTVVIFENKILGKPVDYDDAHRTIKKLAGQQHTVVTGVCISTPQQNKVFSSISKVSLHPMSDEEIAFYVREYEPYDKAGSYGIQDWIGWVKISAIEGSYANVMGLPVDEIYHKLIQMN